MYKESPRSPRHSSFPQMEFSEIRGLQENLGVILWSLRVASYPAFTKQWLELCQVLNTKDLYSPSPNWNLISLIPVLELRTLRHSWDTQGYLPQDSRQWDGDVNPYLFKFQSCVTWAVTNWRLSLWSACSGLRILRKGINRDSETPVIMLFWIMVPTTVRGTSGTKTKKQRNVLRSQTLFACL